MKVREKEFARELRRRGKTFKEILEFVPVSKGTLSLWCRDIILTDSQMKTIADAHHERIALAVKASRDRRWLSYQQEADSEWSTLLGNLDFQFGLALYVGEGNKTGSPGVSNSDPRVLRRVIQFFGLLSVPSSNLRVAIHVHDSALIEESEAYWSEQLEIPRSQFNRTVVAVSRAGKGLRKTLAYGTCTVLTYNTKLFVKILRWIDLALDS
jgi:hypothetical protein